MRMSEKISVHILVGQILLGFSFGAHAAENELLDSLAVPLEGGHKNYSWIGNESVVQAALPQPVEPYQNQERSFATNSLEDGHDEKPVKNQHKPQPEFLFSKTSPSSSSWTNRPWIAVEAQTVTHPSQSFGHDLLEDVKDSKWEALGVFGGITALGAESWEWGSSSFHFHSEGFWGDESSSGAIDKFGHAFSSYTLTNIFAERLKAKGRSNDRAALNAFLLTEAMMLYVEAFDGFASDHGFAYEDVIANNIGAAIAYLRQRNPKIHDLIDYRMEYRQSDYKAYLPLSDYAGQKFYLALKLGGIDALSDSPLKYVAVLGGYYARGYTDGERTDQIDKKRVAFVGLSVDLSQVFFGKREKNDENWKRVGRFASEHIQIPKTYTGFKSDF
jgi:hypothetical protein